jgi:NTE family protein
MPHFQPPDVLVLGAGGILGEAWMSAILVGLTEAADFDARACEGFVGTSAGAIVAAALAVGIDPAKRLGELPEQPPLVSADGMAPAADAGIRGRAVEAGLAAGRAAAAPLAAAGLRAREPGGALLRRALLGFVPEGRRSLRGLGRQLDQAGAKWDGRLAIATVQLDSGRRVVFGKPGAPEAKVGTAVEASCAIPGVFKPVAIDGRSYVDGGAWSATNMDVAAAREGARVLCLNPTGSMRPRLDAPFGAYGLLSRGGAAVEALALERRGAQVDTVAPDAEAAEAMGPNLMDPRRRSQTIAAGLAQGRALAGA